MEVKLAVLADYANVTQEGKLNILGIFTNINARTFPATHGQMQVIVSLEGHSVEAERPHHTEVHFRDADGGKIFDLKGQVFAQNARPGRPFTVNQIIQLANLPLPRPGDYSFAIFVDNDLKGTIPLSVTQIEADPPEQQRLPGT
jgi:hypothetical protein